MFSNTTYKIQNQKHFIKDLSWANVRFGQYLKKVNKWISHRIFKMWFGRGGHIFSSKKKSEKAKHLRMCPSIGGNVGEAWLRWGPFITRPYSRCIGRWRREKSKFQIQSTPPIVKVRNVVKHSLCTRMDQLCSLATVQLNYLLRIQRKNTP